MNINSKLSVYQAQAGAEVAQEDAEIQEDMRGGALGFLNRKVIPAIQGATTGFELGKTASPLFENFKVRRAAKKEFGNNAEMQKKHGGSFRSFYQTEIKNPAAADYRRAGKTGAVTGIDYDDEGNMIDGPVLMSASERSGNPLEDKAAIKALYLTGVKSYREQNKVNKETGKIEPEVIQDNPGFNVNDIRGSYKNILKPIDTNAVFADVNKRTFDFTPKNQFQSPELIEPNFGNFNMIDMYNRVNNIDNNYVPFTGTSTHKMDMDS
jgi:hypothetical protein